MVEPVATIPRYRKGVAGDIPVAMKAPRPSEPALNAIVYNHREKRRGVDFGVDFIYNGTAFHHQFDKMGELRIVRRFQIRKRFQLIERGRFGANLGAGLRVFAAKEG